MCKNSRAFEIIRRHHYTSHAHQFRRRIAQQRYREWARDERKNKHENRGSVEYSHKLKCWCHSLSWDTLRVFDAFVVSFRSVSFHVFSFIRCRHWTDTETKCGTAENFHIRIALWQNGSKYRYLWMCSQLHNACKIKEKTEHRCSNSNILIYYIDTKQNLVFSVRHQFRSIHSFNVFTRALIYDIGRAPVACSFLLRRIDNDWNPAHRLGKTTMSATYIQNPIKKNMRERKPKKKPQWRGDKKFAHNFYTQLTRKIMHRCSI